jgi:hypothetical protein
MPQEMPPDQASAVAGRILRTWWFWLILIIITWSGLFLVQRITQIQNERFESDLARSASNQVLESLTLMSNRLHAQLAYSASNQLRRGFGDISNHLGTALNQSQLRNAIAAAAARQASESVMSSISPALSNIEARLAQDELRLKAATNATSPAPIAEVAPTPGSSDSNAPPGIIKYAESVIPHGSGYILTASFKESGSGSLGRLRFDIGVFNQMPARIDGVDVACEAGPIVQREVVTGGLEAVLGFTPSDGVDPALSLSLTGPTVVQITSDALPEPWTISVLGSTTPGSPTPTNP